MATADENRTLSTETADALLTAVRTQADRWTAPNDLLALAQAYATIVENMPKPKSQGRSVYSN